MKKKIFTPLWVSVMLTVGFCMLIVNHNDMFAEVEKAYEEGKAVNLDKDTKAGELARMLHANGYFEHLEDANFVAEWIANKLKDHETPNLGTLNKEDFRIPVLTALSSGGPDIRTRAGEAMLEQGYTPEVERMYAQPRDSANRAAGVGAHTVKAVVLRPDSSIGFWTKAWRNAGQRLGVMPAGKPAPGVLVCLRGYSYDKSSDAYGNETCGEVRDSVVAYGMTDSCGVAEFRVPEGYYSVRPVAMGKAYGPAKGTTDDRLHSDKEWFFTEKELTMAPLSTRQYARAKQDIALTVRTPAQYKDSLFFCFLAFLAAWWGGWLLISWLDKRHLRPGNGATHVKAPIDDITYFLLMTITSICILSMFSIAHPLTDSNLGRDMTQGVVMGVAAMCAVSRLSLPAFINRRREASSSLPDGFGYFALAVILMLGLALFGTGPEGSSAKVNLLFFQPSEVIKYLMVLMTAIFFSKKAELVQAFSQQNDLRRQARLLAAVTGCMLVVIGLFAMLNDLGPALVATVTFIMMYSVARKDSVQLVIGVITYIAVLLLARWLNPTQATALAASLAWLAAWVGLWWLFRRKFYESAVMMALVISAFLFSGDFFALMGWDDMASRLAGRHAMTWSGIWNNESSGGDQVAHGIWALASGGLTGQGLGRGCPNYIPAFQTDMVLASIGETMGWLGVALIVVCMTILVHRTLLLSRRAGHPFVFFLLAGIGIATAVQSFVIVAGSLGLIDLTGVSLVFVSSGRASMIVNLAAYGAVLSGSRERGTNNQRNAIKPYNNVVAFSVLTFIVLDAIVLADMFDYQVAHRNKYLVRPALMADANGTPVVEYNPRIKRVEILMKAGNIYDRNGLLLATSDPDDIDRQMMVLLERAGLEREGLSALKAQRGKLRYYPFGMNTVFAVGDLNEGLVSDGYADYPQGYGAEYRHLTRLRGFDNLRYDSTGSKETTMISTTRFHPCRFLPKTKKSFNVLMRDYSDPRIISMLKSGGRQLVNEWNSERASRDIQLTLDARLQTMMQTNLERTFRPITQAAGDSPRRKIRVAVVVTDAASGDLLCSANYPMPTKESIRLKERYSSLERDREATSVTQQDLGTTFGTPPGSTAKVITQMAAFRKLGTDASRITYDIQASEAIHDNQGTVGMQAALVWSNNAFHIHLAHDQNLYPQYADIDYLAGIRLQLGLSGEDRRSFTPYYFHPGERLCDSTDYRNEMGHLGQAALPQYRHLREQGRRVDNRPWTASALFAIAWGQNHIHPTPLAMARIAGIVANDGKFVPTRYLADDPQPEPVEVIDTRSAHILQESMRAETQKHQRNSNGRYNLPATMGGKTGTAERNMPGRGKVNDAWYVCFIPRQGDNGPLAVAIRIERAVSNSSMAVRYINEVVLQTLREAGYLIDGE